MNSIHYIGDINGLSVTEKYSFKEIGGTPHVLIEIITNFQNPYLNSAKRLDHNARLTLFPNLAAQVADLINSKKIIYPIGEITTAGICIKTCCYGSEKGSKILFGKQFLEVLQAKVKFTRPIPVSYIAHEEADPVDMIVSRRHSSRFYRSKIKTDMSGFDPDHGKMSAVFQFAARWEANDLISTGS